MPCFVHSTGNGKNKLVVLYEAIRNGGSYEHIIPAGGTLWEGDLDLSIFNRYVLIWRDLSDRTAIEIEGTNYNSYSYVVSMEPVYIHHGPDSFDWQIFGSPIDNYDGITNFGVESIRGVQENGRLKRVYCDRETTFWGAGTEGGLSLHWTSSIFIV